jgi:hypothetical protein
MIEKEQVCTTVLLVCTGSDLLTAAAKTRSFAKGMQ